MQQFVANHRRSVLFGTLFLLAGFLVYTRSLGAAFVNYDDLYLIAYNPYIAGLSFENIRHAFTTFDPELYVPFTTLSYQLNYAMGGYEPFAYHLTSLLLHIGSSLFVFLIIKKVWKNEWVAFFLGLFFLVHPINTEAVMWASARKDVLSGFFTLAALYAYLSSRNSKRVFVLSIVLFIAALLSKVTAATLVPILFLFEWREGNLSKSSIIRLWPYVLSALILGIVAIMGKSETNSLLGAWPTLILFVRSAGLALVHSALPLALSPLYPAVAYTSDTFIYVFILALVISVISLKRTKEVMFGFLVFFLSYIPVLVTFSKDGELYLGSDRYAYIALLGVLFIAAALLSKVSKIITAILLTLLVTLFGLVSVIQASHWRSSAALWEHVLRLYPQTSIGRINYAVILRDSGDLAGAEETIRPLLTRSHAKAFSVHASILRAKGELSGAAEAYEQALLINPNLQDAVLGLGIVYREQGNFAEAEVQFEEAIRLDPNYGSAYNDLGDLYMQVQDFERAEALFRKSVELNPAEPRAHYNLGIALQRQRKIDEAFIEFTTALQLKPDYADAYVNLASIYLIRGDDENARKALQEALGLNPNHPGALQLLEIIKK